MLIASTHLLSQLVVQTCQEYCIDTIVVSPGSRNAPLIIGFNNAKNIKILSIVDERCAAFFALGIAQQQQKPVALLCTSGSALLNYYPAVAEAFYSHIPLIILSADRPSHLIDVGDGQTIRQHHVFANHSLYNVNLGGKDDEINISTAFKIALEKKGPVHINIPFDEPLYETIEIPQKNLKKIPDVTENIFLEDIRQYTTTWNQSSKKMILVGQHFPDKNLQLWLEKLSEDPSVLILVENTANVSHKKFINSIDKLIFPFEEAEAEKFRPDVLITIGGLIVSKKIKQHLRKFQPKHHWHVDPENANDTFLCLKKHFKTTFHQFFNNFTKETQIATSSYQSYWLEKKKKRLERHNIFFKDASFSDIKVFHFIFASLPKDIQLQLSNSSVIRYAQLFDIDSSITIFCNRGTSGIDGSTSTAIGAAYAYTKPTVFITGDISFFYDSNALWNQYIPKNFKIILLNNNGGGIFRFIPGPQKSNALHYFETPHQLTAVHLCKMFDIKYLSAKNEEELSKQLSIFYKHNAKPVLLEIHTPRTLNDEVLKAYFKNLKY